MHVCYHVHIVQDYKLCPLTNLFSHLTQTHCYAAKHMLYSYSHIQTEDTGIKQSTL